MSDRSAPARFLIHLTLSTLLAGTLAFSPAAGPPAYAQADNAKAAPVAAAAKATHDLGVVGIGTDPEFEFPIRNTGRAPLELTVTFVPRGLRLVRLDDKIAPSASGVVRLALDTFQSGSATEWRVNVLTNDPDHGSIELTVRADIRAFVVLSPPAARFNFVQHGPEGGTSHIVAAADDTAMDVQGVDSPFDYIKATVREAKPDERLPDVAGRQWRVDLTISATAPVGPIGGYAIVRTTHPKQPRAFLPVTGFVRPLFAVTPPSVNLPDLGLTDGDRPILTLVIKNFGADPIEISNVSTDIAGLAAKLLAVDNGHVWRVELRQTPALAAGPFKGTLKVKTASAKVPELIVPVEGNKK